MDSFDMWELLPNQFFIRLYKGFNFHILAKHYNYLAPWFCRNIVLVFRIPKQWRGWGRSLRDYIYCYNKLLSKLCDLCWFHFYEFFLHNGSDPLWPGCYNSKFWFWLGSERLIHHRWLDTSIVIQEKWMDFHSYSCILPKYGILDNQW